MEYDSITIRWDGHASLRFIDNGFTVAVDPYSSVSPGFEADIVLITHKHEGHFDPGKLEQVCGDGTCVVVPESISDSEIPCSDVEVIEEGETIDVYNVEVEAVPMYNEHHDRGEGVGYRFVMAGNRFYVAGDTELIEEVHDLEGRVDVAFLPIDGVYTMNIEEAVQLAARIKPEIVVPYHYGEPFFGEKNTQPLETALEDRSVRCEVLEPEA